MSPHGILERPGAPKNIKNYQINKQTSLNEQLIILLITSY